MMLLIYEQMKKFKLSLEVTLKRNIMLQMELGETLDLEDRLIIMVPRKVWSLYVVKHFEEYLELLK